MSNPKVSVIIPCYNREDSVREAVDSVLSQDYDNFDVIAVDDNSTDGTLDVLNSIKDSRLRIVSNPGNNGPSSTKSPQYTPTQLLSLTKSICLRNLPGNHKSSLS